MNDKFIKLVVIFFMVITVINVNEASVVCFGEDGHIRIEITETLKETIILNSVPNGDEHVFLNRSSDYFNKCGECVDLKFSVEKYLNRSKPISRIDLSEAHLLENMFSSDVSAKKRFTLLRVVSEKIYPFCDSVENLKKVVLII